MTHSFIQFKSTIRFVLLCFLALSLGSASLQAQSCDITQGLIHEWKFDGNTTDNIGGNSPSGSFNYTNDRNGNSNKSLNFPTMTSATYLTNTIPVTSVTDITMSFWVKTPGYYLGASWGYFGHNSAGNTFLGIYADNPTTPLADGAFGLWNPTQGVVMQNGFTAKFNTWYYVAYVKEADSVSLFVNGKFHCKAQINNLAMSEIRYLQGRGVGNTTLPGVYDDYRIYNRAITAAEVDTLFSRSYLPFYEGEIKNVNLCSSNFGSFLTAPSNLGIYTYQWLKNGNPLSGENMDKLYFHTPSPSDAGNYQVVLINDCGLTDTTDIATVTFGALPNFNINLTQDILFNGGAYNGFSLLTPPTATDVNTSVDRFGVNGRAVQVKTKAGGISLSTPFNDTSSTISLWYQYNSAGNSNLTYILGAPALGATNNASFSPLGVSINNELGIISTGGTGGFWGSGVYLENSKWYHITAVINSNVCRIYVNSVLVKTYTNLQLLTNYPITHVGNTGQGAIAPYRGAMGMIDDIRFYNTALGQQAIYDLYSEMYLNWSYSLSASTTFCKGARVPIEAKPQSGNPSVTFTYKWKKDNVYLENNEIYTGVTAKLLEIKTLTAAEQGLYQCEVFSNENCTQINTSNISILVNTADSIGMDLTVTQPSCGTPGNIVFTATNAAAINYSLNGTFVNQIPSASWPFTLSNLTTGVYDFIAIHQSNGCAVSKRVYINSASKDSLYTIAGNLECSNGNTAVEAEACNVSGNAWYNLYDKVTGLLIGSVNPQGQNLGNVTMTLYNEKDNAAAIMANNNLNQFNMNYLHKSFVINSSNAPVSNVNVRFYYTDRDLFTMKNAIGCSNCTASDMVVSHVSNVSSDCNASNNMGGNLRLYWSKNPANTVSETMHVQSYLQSPANAMYGNVNLQTVGGSNSQGTALGGRYFEIVTSSFSEFRMHMAPNIPLPATMNTFDVQLVNDQSELTWETMQETNVLHFEVEKSNDAKNWSLLKTVQANGNSTTPSQYETLDQTPGIGKTYYRIKTLDIDGKFQYSIVKDVYRHASGSITMYPNPANHTLYVSTDNIQLPATLQIVSLDGKILSQSTLLNTINTLNVASLYAGMYLVKITDKDGVIHMNKLEKQ